MNSRYKDPKTQRILRKVLGLLTLVSFITGCQGSKTDDGKKSLIGKYAFTASDTLDKMLIDGMMEILKKDGKVLSGKYEVMNRHAEPNELSGIKDKGYFEGQVDEKNGRVFFNLTPKLADNNIFVDAEWKNDSTLAGTWTHSTIVGINAKGDFRAVKIP
jgi:hypothetical protein